MISLVNYIKEGIFDDEITVSRKSDKAILKAQRDSVRDFVMQNYTGIGRIKVSEKRNSDGLYEVSTKGNAELKWHSDRITNGDFTWTEVGKSFKLYFCEAENLEGCPKKVGHDFIMNGCDIKSLKGCPEYVGGRMFITRCNDLTSLEYAPKQIGEEGLKSSLLRVDYCNNIKSIEGCPSIVGMLHLHELPKLNSLKGCPENVFEISLWDLYVLKDLKYFPKKANTIHINSCPIKSLKGICSAKQIRINHTDIENLEGMPDVENGYFNLDLYSNEKLKTLKGGPSDVFNLNLSACDKLTAQGMEDKHIYVSGRLNPPPGITYSNLPKGWTYASLGYW